MDQGKEGEVDHFLSPDELWTKTSKKENSWRDKLLSIPCNFKEQQDLVCILYDLMIIISISK